MFKDYILPVLLVVAGLIVYDMVFKKLLKIGSYEENYELDSNGQIMKVA